MFRRGVITLVFDDGYTSVKENVVPELKRRNISAVFALPLSTERMRREGMPATEPWETWLPLHRDGHELAAHSVDHVDLTSLSPNQREHQLTEPVRKLDATTIIYPGGAHNDEVVAQAQEFYRAGRTVTPGFESLPPRDPMRLKTYNFTRQNFSVVKANLLAVWAYLTGSWLIETYHEVSDTEKKYRHTVPLAGFKRHLAFISVLPLNIQTIAKTLTTS